MPRISFTTYEDFQKMPQWLQMQEALEPLPNRGNGAGEWERQQPTFPTKGVLKDLKPPWLQCDLKVHISTESSLEYSSPLPHDKILSVYGHSLKVCSDGIPEEGFRRFRSYKPLRTTQKTVFSSVLGMPNNLYNQTQIPESQLCFPQSILFSFRSSSYSTILRDF